MLPLTYNLYPELLDYMPFLSDPADLHDPGQATAPQQQQVVGLTAAAGAGGVATGVR